MDGLPYTYHGINCALNTGHYGLTHTSVSIQIYTATILTIHLLYKNTNNSTLNTVEISTHLFSYADWIYTISICTSYLLPAIGNACSVWTSRVTGT